VSKAVIQEELKAIEAGMGAGTLSVSATYLPTGESLFYNAEVVFPTASVIKVAIVSELFTQRAEGRLPLDATGTVTAAGKTPGSGVLALLADGVTLSLPDLAMLTICISDNTASNLCLAAVGGPEVVNKRMRETWGLTDTTIHRPIKFALEEGDPPHTATGTTTDMMRLLTLLEAGKVHNRAVSDEVLACMAQVRDAELLPRYLAVNPYASIQRADVPPFVVRHKGGAVNGVRNDAALISQGEKTLAVCVYSKGCLDQRWTPENAGSAAVAAVGRLLCDYVFES
jgi:beta-lactamase class A